MCEIGQRFVGTSYAVSDGKLLKWFSNNGETAACRFFGHILRVRIQLRKEATVKRATGIGGVCLSLRAGKDSIDGTKSTWAYGEHRSAQPCLIGGRPKIREEGDDRLVDPPARQVLRSQPVRLHDQLSRRGSGRDAEVLKTEGVQIDPHREDHDYGRFAWIMDPTASVSSRGSCRSNDGGRPSRPSCAGPSARFE